MGYEVLYQYQPIKPLIYELFIHTHTHTHAKNEWPFLCLNQFWPFDYFNPGHFVWMVFLFLSVFSSFVAAQTNPPVAPNPLIGIYINCTEEIVGELDASANFTPGFLTNKYWADFDTSKFDYIVDHDLSPILEDFFDPSKPEYNDTSRIDALDVWYQGLRLRLPNAQFGLVIDQRDDYPINNTNDFYLTFDEDLLPSMACYLPSINSPVKASDSIHLIHQKIVNDFLNPGLDADSLTWKYALMARTVALAIYGEYYINSPDSNKRQSSGQVRVRNYAAESFAMKQISVISIEDEYWNAGSDSLNYVRYKKHIELLDVVRTLICYSYRNILLEDYVNISSSIGELNNLNTPKVSKQTQANEIDALTDRIVYPSFDNDPFGVVDRAGRDMRFFGNTLKPTAFFFLNNIWEDFVDAPKYDCYGQLVGNHGVDIGILDYLVNKNQNLLGFTSETRFEYLTHPVNVAAQYPNYPTGNLVLLGTVFNDLAHLSKHPVYRLDIDEFHAIEVEFHGNGQVSVAFDQEENGSYKIQIYSVTGNLLFFNDSYSSGELIDLVDFTSEFLILRFMKNDHWLTQKFVLSK